MCDLLLCLPTDAFCLRFCLLLRFCNLALCLGLQCSDPVFSIFFRCGKCIRACPTQAIRFRYGFGLNGNTNPKQVSNHQNQTEES